MKKLLDLIDVKSIVTLAMTAAMIALRSEEHTSELQSPQ